MEPVYGQQYTPYLEAIKILEIQFCVLQKGEQAKNEFVVSSIVFPRITVKWTMLETTTAPLVFPLTKKPSTPITEVYAFSSEVSNKQKQNKQNKRLTKV